MAESGLTPLLLLQVPSHSTGYGEVQTKAHCTLLTEHRNDITVFSQFPQEYR